MYSKTRGQRYHVCIKTQFIPAVVTIEIGSYTRHPQAQAMKSGLQYAKSSYPTYMTAVSMALAVSLPTNEICIYIVYEVQ